MLQTQINITLCSVSQPECRDKSARGDAGFSWAGNSGTDSSQSYKSAVNPKRLENTAIGPGKIKMMLPILCQNIILHAC